MSFKNDMGWHGAKLSERPVLVYGSDSRPKYYEFIVHNDKGEALGTLTAYAKRESDAAVAFALPSVRDYAMVTTKYVSSQLFASSYPRIAYGIAGKSGDEPVSVVNEVGENAIASVEGSNEKQLEHYEQSNLPSKELEWVKSQIDEVDLRAQAYWQLMDEIKDSIFATTDEEIIERCNEAKGWQEWKTEDIYHISAYNTAAMRQTLWGGWCGPSALAWLYRELYSSYNGKYIYLYGDAGFDNRNDHRINNSPINGRGEYRFTGDPNDLNLSWIKERSMTADNGLYYELCRAGNLTRVNGQGATMPGNLSPALSSVTGGQYTIENVSYNNARGSMRSTNLPVMVCVLNDLHYVVGVGIRNIDFHCKLTTTVKVFGWKKTVTVFSDSWRQSEWMLVHDNGFETGDFNYLPYWQQTYVYFHYKVVKNW